MRPSTKSRADNIVKLDVSSLPASVNWLEKGAVAPVQNQLTCGSCWAFSAVASMEGAHFLKTGKLVKLSEQQCLDCVDGDNCAGGNQADCFEYAEDMAIETEAEYPYKNFKNSCWDKPGEVEVSTVNQVVKKSAAQLKAAIAKQPVSVTISGYKYPFIHYMSGVITSSECGTSQNHGVLAVGYGTENGQDYYLVKNSWGADWGEHGYVKIGIKEGDAGICGIQTNPAYPSTN